MADYPSGEEAGFPPPARGRVREGVTEKLSEESANGISWPHKAGMLTPTRHAPKRESASQRADLPLSGGGERKLSLPVTRPVRPSRSRRAGSPRAIRHRRNNPRSDA